MCAAHFTCVQYVEVKESCHVKVDINFKKKNAYGKKQVALSVSGGGAGRGG